MLSIWACTSSSFPLSPTLPIHRVLVVECFIPFFCPSMSSQCSIVNCVSTQLIIHLCHSHALRGFVNHASRIPFSLLLLWPDLNITQTHTNFQMNYIQHPPQKKIIFNPHSPQSSTYTPPLTNPHHTQK